MGAAAYKFTFLLSLVLLVFSFSCQRELSFPENGATDPTPGNEKLTIKVLVLNYDPYLSSGGGKKRIHEYYGWADPRSLADRYADALTEVSGGFVNFSIVEFRDIDEFPVKADGFRYTESE